MKAVNIVNPGLQASLTVVAKPVPHFGADDVLIKVFAAGVNRADIFQKQGKYPPPQGASDILGLEVAGQIENIGSNVLGFKIGDKVCALLEGGGYSEYVAVSSKQVLPVPEGLSFIEAAAIPEVFFTCWSNLFDYAGIKKGESLLVHGGASGVGTTAIQLANAFGVRCFTTAGSNKKCEFLSDELKAFRAINYKTEDFVSVIKDATSEKGVDVVMDMVGGDYFQKNMSCLGKNGRLVCISFLNGAKAEVNFAPMLFKNLKILGTTLRNKSADEKGKIAEQLYKNVWPLFEDGKIKPVIDSVFSLEEASKAHDKMNSGEHIGKIILNLR